MSSSLSLPILDFGPYLDEKSTAAEKSRHLEELAAQLRRASLEVGFYFVAGAEAVVPESLVNEMFEVTQRFHGLEIGEKMRYEQDPKTRTGYMRNEADSSQTTGSLQKGGSENSRPALSPTQVESKKLAGVGFNEAFFVGKTLPGGVLGGKYADLLGNPWPEEVLPELHQTVTRYDACMARLRAKMLPVYAKALGMPEEELEALFNNHELVRYRLTHYPETPPTNLSGEKNEAEEETTKQKLWGIAPHVDTTFLTILAQNEVPGLELRLPNTGQWIPVPAIPRTFLVNTGEFLHRISNGRFRNTVHRVENRSGRERYAVVNFVSFDKNAVFAPLIEPGEEPRWGASFTAKDVYRDITKNPTGLTLKNDKYLGAKL